MVSKLGFMKQHGEISDGKVRLSVSVDFGGRLCDGVVPVARSTAACWLSNAIVLNLLGWSCGCHGSENFGFCSGRAMVLWWLESWIL